jgi:hypothetical protein
VTDPLPWLNDDLTVITRNFGSNSEGDESYLQFLRPETLTALKTWRKDNGNQTDVLNRRES